MSEHVMKRKFVIRCCICIYFNSLSKSLKYVDYGMHARKLDKSKSPCNILCEVPDNLMCQEQFDIVLFADGVCLSEFYRPRTFGVQIHVARTAKSLSRMTFCIQSTVCSRFLIFFVHSPKKTSKPWAGRCATQFC